MRFMLLTEKQDAVSALTEQGGLGWMTIGKWQAFHESFPSKAESTPSEPRAAE